MRRLGLAAALALAAACAPKRDDLTVDWTFAGKTCADAGVVPHVLVQSALDPLQHAVRIVVQDNGPGIAPASRESVFRPFFTTKRNGTGLGLALVQKIIVFHNGRITVGSSPLGGASLQISLPIESSLA